jgi:hypothetical protein
MLRRFAGWLMALQEPRRRVPFACHIGWHVPKMRTAADGSLFCGCAHCDHRNDR